MHGEGTFGDRPEPPKNQAAYAVRVRYRQGGAHVHCKVFIRPTGGGDTYAKLGDLCMTAHEWGALLAFASRPMPASSPFTIEILPEDGKPLQVPV